MSNASSSSTTPEDDYDYGPAEPELIDIPSDELPGMWEQADFTGGQDAVWDEQRKRWI